jgi:hypothetical protein
MSGALPTEGANYTGPCYEYIQILRSYLSLDQRIGVRLKVEAHFQIHGRGDSDGLAYAELLQSYLTRDQKADALERLELVYERRGWRVPARGA